MQRRLAAILAADISEFSRLIDCDEEGTLAAQRAHRTELIDPLLQTHVGRIANTAGDSLLIEFPSAVEAVRFAKAMQAGVEDRNASIPQDRRIQYRIGINVGDVVAQGDDLLGDGVNVAARLEALAPPGGTILSRTARDQVRDRMQINLADLGEISVKNISRPIRAFQLLRNDETAMKAPNRAARQARLIAAIVAVVALGFGGWVLWLYKASDHSSKAHRLSELNSSQVASIAVLPFNNMSGDADQEYFSDGISEDIITDLSKYSGLLVVARNSSFTYKGKVVNVQQVGRDLSVSHVLEGSVRKSDNRVRITAQLSNTATGKHIWAERYDRNLHDVFAVQDDVTKQIVTALAVKLAAGEAARSRRSVTIDPDAYDVLLRGVEKLRRYGRESNLEARALFERAVAIDRRFGRAYANIAYTHVLDVLNGHSNDQDKSLKEAEKALVEAERLDGTLPQLLGTRSTLHRIRREYKRAHSDIEKMIQLYPNNAEAYVNLCLVLNYMGRPAEGLEAIKRGLQLDPRNLTFFLFVKGMSLFHLERFEEAAQTLEKAVSQNPDFVRGHLLLAATYTHLGRSDDAEWQVSEAKTLLPHLSLSQQREVVPYKRKSDIDRYLDGLRRAGVTE